ncbi:FAD-dependent oxidoreductase [Pseudonocardia asaccharolytica]|uniref:FAD-binding monooxygenase n=1 Tax=Pseudonocardia asaccharolytica DSM 44247 = NBRC 16224 TaxID=1123024 RepID=A0A511CZJ7_9PSEU|nr:NAD(P)-binding protein [Pseudonocardia asaccharolytica]GEL17959.1 FAD-binding monooxygenase [Pseudonocardia asaccharolytica DSM 44247 = NBRC 16224]
MDTQIGDHALVLGGGMAGLLTARVLADAYTEVTVVERDALPVGCAPRRGVPQARHAHALLARGQQVLEELFPGLTAELVAGGVPTGDFLRDVRMYLGGHQMRRVETGLVAVSASRAFLEHHVRARVHALPGVTFVDRTDVLGLAATSDRSRVTGARIIRRADGSVEEVLAADLVVDATGRGSRTPLWLDELDYRRPEEQRVPIDVGYATRMYRIGGDVLDGDLAILHGPTARRPRAGVLARLEGGRWMLTLAGVLGDHPPTEPDGFVEFARSLQFPDIHQALRDAEPLDDPVRFRFPVSLRRRYERLARFPDGLLVTGDGLCSFNPVYGQGMTVAALEALALRRHLRRGGQPRPARFHRDAARVIDGPWSIAVGGDLAFPGVEGRRTPAVRFLNAYVARLHAAAARDGRLARAFVRVSGLVDPPQALLRPGVVVRVLQAPARRPRGLSHPGPAGRRLSATGVTVGARADEAVLE